MKPYVTVFGAVFSALVLSACEGNSPSPAIADDAEAASETTAAEAPTAAASPVTQTGMPLVDGAPAYASLYPEASLTKPVLNAAEGKRSGGIAEFTTQANAETVIQHYRQLAESNGLSVTMEMNQGNARAIGAGNNAGAELQVVAAPVGEGTTSVQLTWQATPN